LHSWFSPADMNNPDSATRRANRRLFVALAIFAVLLCAAVILWKTFYT
jgi:hypothetical protein